MDKDLNTNTTVNTAPVRRLSLVRVVIALAVLIGIAAFTFLNYQEWEGSKGVSEVSSWFAPYVDVTATPYYEFEKLGATPAKHVVLSFIVASSTDPCVPTWGNAFTLDEASVALDLDRRIARLRQLDGDIAISFGGLLNDEPAVVCTDPDKLAQLYLSVIEKYGVETLDFDLEGRGLTDLEAAARRAKVLAGLQEKLRSEGRELTIWLTLPVIPQGLTEDGTNAVAIMLENGVDLAGVNVMTMNYGESKQEQSMAEATKRALIETHRQLGILYRQAGINLNSASLWKKIGATPMIGQNDIAGEIFSLEDAAELNKYALSQGIMRLSMWSANRDIQCGDNYVNVTIVSDSCSGVRQEALSFALTLGKDLEGNFSQNHYVTTEDPEDHNLTDDPEHSPYPIWNENHVYLAGTKIVWHRNVYQAKWWTQGDLPDNPVLQSWQTPWQLVGPVLPGEKPVKLLTLPEGTYPEWSGTVIYDAGDRVLFDGIAYLAKWWTQGDSPAATNANPTISPWNPLTQAQIKEVLEQFE